MGLNQLRDEVHKNAVEHGWWDEERSFGEIIALCHSELSEALEEFRARKDLVYFDCQSEVPPEDTGNCDLHCERDCKHARPEGIAIELADCMIRILDFCGQAEIDIEEAIRIKHEYNKTRPYKHGGKRI